MNLRLKSTFSAIGFLIGVIGLILSIYFYQQQKQFKSLSFVVAPKQTLLFSPKQLSTSKLTLLDGSGKPITGDIYSVEAFMWNSGTETILQSDVIVPIEISIPKDIRLLEFRPSYISRLEVTDISLSPPSADLKLKVSFRVLEPGDGIRIVFIYEGNKDVTFPIQGGIVGIKYINDSKRIAHDEKWAAPWKKYIKDLRFFFVIMCFALFLPFIEWLWSLASKYLFPKHATRILNAMMIIFGGLFALLILAGAVLFIIEPWLKPEKIVEDTITDYVPTEIK